MRKQHYELISGKSAKYWEVSVRGSSLTTAYGRIKTKGQRTVKEFESPKAAKTAAEKLIAQKLKKGYTQTGGAKTQAKAKPAIKKTAKKKTVRKVQKKKVDVTKLGESAALKVAKLPDTSKTDLRKLVGRFDRVDRALAKRDDLSAALLETLSHSSDRITRRNVAANPNCGSKTLLHLAPQFPAEFLKSPQFNSMLIEDPACFHKMDGDILVRLLKQESCPEALVQYGLQLGQQSNLSEGQAAVFLLAAARQLEEKYPDLKEWESFAPAIQPRYEAICEDVEPNLANRKGSGLGRLPFLSKRFPMLKTHVPMLQLDLDEASRVTNEDLGNGLLQVWMPGEMWGYGQELSAKCIRIIPRHIVRSTKHLIDVPEHQAVTDLVQNICEEGVDHWESDYSEELWLEQVDGNLWRLDGDVAHYKPIQALQITGWNAVGYSIPKDSGGFWGGLPRRKSSMIRFIRLWTKLLQPLTNCRRGIRPAYSVNRLM
jgi:predicted DNA-binding WGR domain protein